MHWIVPRGADATQVGEFVDIGVGLSIDSDVRVDRGDIVREVLPNTWLINRATIGAVVQIN